MTAQELLTAYAKGERNFSRADLSGAHLEGADGAVRDPAFAAWLVNIMLDGATLADHNDVLRGHPTTPCARAANVSAARVYLLGGDTTNTLLRVEHEGKTAVVKLFRQCRPGILDFLTIADTEIRLSGQF
jgi:uncharacterized protein YjbI with pentapeptide repeats